MNDKNNPVYNTSYYSKISNWSTNSAKIVVPLLLKLIKPKSVIDVGCGDGTWLSIFHEHGIKDFLGIDGKYVSDEFLKIPTEMFISRDLNKPININRKFDLAICLEVAEHLEESSSTVIVNSLCNLSGIVVFSAAIPYQPGDDHKNPQWPGYWINLFEKRGYKLVNILKYRLWDEPDIAFFYKQNILLFVDPTRFEELGELVSDLDQYKQLPVSIIHPDLYVYNSTHSLDQVEDERFIHIVSSRIKRRFRILR